MNFFKFQISIHSVLQRLLGGDAPPNKVIEVKADSYGTSNTLLREEGLQLYGPATTPTDTSKKVIYEIVVHKPFPETMNSSFSLYRAQSRKEAEEKFQAFIHRIPIFVTIVKEVRILMELIFLKLFQILYNNFPDV